MRSIAAAKSSTGPSSALGSIASRPSSSSRTIDAAGSAPRTSSACASPAAGIAVVSVTTKRLSASREPIGRRLASASTAAGWSRCSVSSSAVPVGRIRSADGIMPCASRIAASRDALYRPSADRNARRGSSGRGLGCGCGCGDPVAIGDRPLYAHQARRVTDPAELLDHGLRLVGTDQEHRVRQPAQHPACQRLARQQLLGQHRLDGADQRHVPVQLDRDACARSGHVRAPRVMGGADRR